MKKTLLVLSLTSFLFSCETRENPKSNQTEKNKDEVQKEPRKIAQPYNQRRGQQISMRVGEDQYVTDSDRLLVQRIRQGLASDPQLSNAAKNITITTNSGKITLEGFVNTGREKNLLTAKLRQMRGINSIDNRLMVNEQKANYAK